MTAADAIDAAIRDYRAAREHLYAIVLAACPGDHYVVQHRDGKPPWCPHCGRKMLGELVGEVAP